MEKNNYIYIENDSLDVYYNFALEYYLTSEKPFRDKTVFLIWRTTPTVMVGKFQNTYREINSRFVEENDINVVRRMSGGGTIFTDLGGWQFTFIAPAQSEQISFREYTEPVIEVLQSLGVEAYFDGRNDIMVDGKMCIRDSDRTDRTEYQEFTGHERSGDLEGINAAVRQGESRKACS